MLTVFFDGIPYKVREGRNLLEAALDNGLNLPYFCWHPIMRSVGACRQCAVRVFKDENDTVGRIQMACMTGAKEGIRANISDPGVIAFRKAVIEWLMINHPHDCPVCDEGGECHLQDMTVMTGHVYRRYRGRKRTYNNQNLGPFVNHEMNRCIQCYRCVRFYRDLADGKDFDVFGSKDRLYFGRYENGVLESEFSGNLVEVCPTGVFTDKTLASHYTRKWDLETAPSICPHCCIGCNTIPGARYQELRRVMNRYNGDVNGHFICDRGRFGYEFNQSAQRLRMAGSRDKGEISVDSAVIDTIEKLRGAWRIAGIGSGRASLEANYALRELVGETNFSPGLADPIHLAVQQAFSVLKDGPVRIPSLHEIEMADAILLLGVDPTNEAPMLDFAIRQATNRTFLDIADEMKVPHWDTYMVLRAAQKPRLILDIATVNPIKLEEIGREVMRGTPEDLLKFADQISDAVRRMASGSTQPAEKIAGYLLQARRPVVITSASADAAMIRMAANIVIRLKAAKVDSALSIVLPECNTMGAALIGGKQVSEILSEIESGAVDTLIILENDLTQLVGEKRAQAVFSKLKSLIVLDSIETPSTKRAEITLPVTTYAESNGTYVNNEGRAQRFFQVFIPEGEQQDSWELLARISREIKPKSAHWTIYEDVTRELSKKIPVLAGAINAAPSSNWRIAQMKISRDPHRYSGRTAMSADKSVREHQSPPDQETPFAYTSDAFNGQVPPALNPRYWAPGWNSYQALTRFQEEVGGPLRGGNPGVRLIEPKAVTLKPFEPEEIRALVENEFWLVPIWKIHGSETLSRLAARIQEVIPDPVILMNPEDAQEIGIKEGDLVGFSIEGEMRELPAKFGNSVPRRVMAVPVGYPETRGIIAVKQAGISRLS